MNLKLTLAGTIAYLFLTFPLAIAWHVVLFEDRYRQFGYFDSEPDFALGFATILLQGFVLALAYPCVRLKGPALVRGLKYALLAGLFLWSCHVLAFVAKQDVVNAAGFMLMESFYLSLQFGGFGLLLGWMGGRWPNPES